MRKILILILAAAMVLSLCACGKTKETPAEMPQTETEAPAEEELPQPELVTDGEDKPEELEPVITGVWEGTYQYVFPVSLALYPDGTGYFTSLTSDNDLSMAVYECGEENAFTLTVDGETYTGTVDLEKNVITLDYLLSKLELNKTGNDWETLLAQYPDIDFTAPAMAEHLWARTLENINIRSDAGTGFDKVDKIEKGTIVELLDMQEADGYTWYKIDEGRWIADDGTWLDICTDLEYIQGYFNAPELTEAEAITLAKEHAAWIKEYVASKYPTVADKPETYLWGAELLEADEEFSNVWTQTKTTIPAGSWRGGCALAIGTEPYNSYDFAIVPVDGVWQVWDLFREDKDVPAETADGADQSGESTDAAEAPDAAETPAETGETPAENSETPAENTTGAAVTNP